METKDLLSLIEQAIPETYESYKIEFKVFFNLLTDRSLFVKNALKCGLSETEDDAICIYNNLIEDAFLKVNTTKDDINNLKNMYKKQLIDNKEFK
ncbi:MAG: hypothetical protein WCH01_15960 [Methylococcaceae bacterium]